MGKHGKKSGHFFFILVGVIAFSVLFAACFITFLEVSSYRDNKEDTSGESASSSAVSTSRPASSSGNPFSPVTATVTDQDLILVNYDHKLPDDYQPDLVSMYGVQINRRAAEAYKKMDTAAASDGISIWISSAYRSSEKQEKLFHEEVSSASDSCSSPQEAETYAEKSVARPGYSEHSTGLAMDLNGVRDDFDTTPASHWLEEHAQEYGFILRYPKDKQEITKIKYEPWHYRYVGVKNAEAMKKNNLCLEEYLAFLQKGKSVH